VIVDLGRAVARGLGAQFGNRHRTQVQTDEERICGVKQWVSRFSPHPFRFTRMTHGSFASLPRAQVPHRREPMPRQTQYMARTGTHAFRRHYSCRLGWWQAALQQGPGLQMLVLLLCLLLKALACPPRFLTAWIIATSSACAHQQILQTSEQILQFQKNPHAIPGTTHQVECGR